MTAKQSAFVGEYLVDLSASQAAIDSLTKVTVLSANAIPDTTLA
jgi:hypothetical protein